MQEVGGWHRQCPPPSLNPEDTLRRCGDLASTGRQPISLAPVTNGLPRERIWLWETTQTENPGPASETTTSGIRASPKPCATHLKSEKVRVDRMGGDTSAVKKKHD